MAKKITLDTAVEIGLIKSYDKCGAITRVVLNNGRDGVGRVGSNQYLYTVITAWGDYEINLKSLKVYELTNELKAIRRILS